MTGEHTVKPPVQVRSVGQGTCACAVSGHSVMLTQQV
jgi:hypothetical protein